MSNNREAVGAGLASANGVSVKHKGGVYAAAILALVALVSLVFVSMDSRFVYLLVYVWFGLVYGLLLQYGRFCMASAVRDLFAVGVPRMAVGVMIAVALYSLTAAAVTMAGFSTFYPHPVGWHIIIGGAIFGFGIVFTGGCASSSLYKSGEGNVGSMLVLVSISFSQAWFVSADWFSGLAPESWTRSAAEKGMPEELTVTSTWFDQFMAGYIWDLQGGTVAQMMGMEGTFTGIFIGNAFLAAILPTFVILVLLYALSFRKGYLRRSKIDNPTFGDHVRGMKAMFTSSKNTAYAGLGLGVFAGLQMWTTGAMRDHYQIFNFGELLEDMGYTAQVSIQGTVFDPGYWYITTQEAQWGGWILDKLGADTTSNIYFGLENGIPNPLLNAPGLMSVGIILGAAMLANINREFKWKWPSLEVAIFALVGGALMGIGARVGMGCNIGAFFAAVTNGDLTGWIFLIGMALGGYFGVKAISWWINWQASRKDDEFAL
ncbi:YeeE/YedE family protein [Thioalkalivibrio thiocyanodenitrificans]|uniref:YeeE/YedE family protein n=1 Tax=Thioalkalivibrio thiocyanodenitrificans TaxID=243063 RepID=UPI000361B75B|nr:YeeE/YedE family protein [Thioalkalivibrio thiocyanodenitrificans]